MSIVPKGLQVDQEILNIISNSAEEKLLEPFTNSIGFFKKDIEEQFNAKILRLSKEKIKVACQIVGCKPFLARSISDQAFEAFQNIATKQWTLNVFDEKTRYYMYTTRTKFLEYFKEILQRMNLMNDRNIFDFEVALSVIEQTKSMIVLLGGTSGSGKSTVASVLASRFGIPTVLSTDSIRHVMRNFMSSEECPVLFCSTYEAGSKIKIEEDVTEKKRVVLGFQQQAAAVQQRLEGILEDFYNRGESIVVEGVHLTPDFLNAMLKKFNNCIPFLIYISNENKHRERFAVRSKYMTLEKRHNKYVQNFESIRNIQKHLTKKADEVLIPKLDNSNIDKSVGIVHRTLVRCLRRMIVGKSLYDPENNNAIKIYEQFNKVTKNIWSSDAVKNYIKNKGRKAHKSEIFKRFFEQNVVTLPKNITSKIEPDFPQAIKDSFKVKDGSNIPSTISGHTRNDSGDEVQPSNKPKAQIAFKEDLILPSSPVKDIKERVGRSTKPKDFSKEEDNIQDGDNSAESSPTRGGNLTDNSPERLDEDHNQRKNSSPKPYDDTVNTKLIVGPSKSIGVVEPLKIRSKDSEDAALIKSQEGRLLKRDDDEDSAKPTKTRSEEIKLDEPQVSSPHLAPRSSLKLSLLEELIAHRRVVTIKGLNKNNVRTLRKFINNYNSKHQEIFLKLYQENQRYIIYKYNKYERDNSPRPNSTLTPTITEGLPQNLSRFGIRKNEDFVTSTNEKPKVSFAKNGDQSQSDENNELPPTKGLIRFKTKRFEEYLQKTHENNKGASGRYKDTNTSEDNLEASDEGSVTSQEKWSNLSESLDVNLYMLKRGSTYHNLSDKFDMSDELDSVTMPEDDDDANLEIIESENSISEASIEEDEDEDEEVVNMHKMTSPFEKNVVTN